MTTLGSFLAYGDLPTAMWTIVSPVHFPQICQLIHFYSGVRAIASNVFGLQTVIWNHDTGESLISYNPSYL